MKKKFLIGFIIILIASIFSITGINSIKTTIAKITNNNYLDGNITSLDTPTWLLWKEGSTATATWNAVENANYYNVEVYVYDV